MNKKSWFYTVGLLIALIAAVGSCIVMAEKLQSQTSEYRNLEKEQDSMITALQQLLNQANKINQDLERQNQENSHYGDYQGDDEFSDLIKANPLDQDYEQELDQLRKSKNSTTLAWGALEAKYTSKWQDEMNATLEHLDQSLNEEDRLNLEQSQTSWQSYMNDDLNFVSHMFIFPGYFGTQGNVQLAAVQLHRTRERAIVLMEYKFSLGRMTAGKSE